jgi:hypothetical protein
MIVKINAQSERSNIRSVELDPVGGDPAGQVSNSQGLVKVVAFLDKEPVPDWFSAGAESTTYQNKR